MYASVYLVCMYVCLYVLVVQYELLFLVSHYLSLLKLYVSSQNIAHHAHAPLGRESSMIHQLNEVRRLLRPQEDSSLGQGFLHCTALYS